MVWLDFLNLKDNENMLYNKSVNYHFLLIVYCIDFYQKPGTMNKNLALNLNFPPLPFNLNL